MSSAQAAGRQTLGVPLQNVASLRAGPRPRPTPAASGSSTSFISAWAGAGSARPRTLPALARHTGVDRAMAASSPAAPARRARTCARTGQARGSGRLGCTRTNPRRGHSGCRHDALAPQASRWQGTARAGIGPRPCWRGTSHGRAIMAVSSPSGATPRVGGRGGQPQRQPASAAGLYYFQWLVALSG